MERDAAKAAATSGAAEAPDVGVILGSYGNLGATSQIYRQRCFDISDADRKSIPAVQAFVKRVMDIVGAILALVIVLPILPIIAIAVKLDSSGPVLYRQKRVGRMGEVFTLYKFRTMIDRADSLLETLLPMNERNGLLFKMTNDPRTTRIGKYLRRYSLDELPQLWNVIKGEMSLVGPRPPVIGEYEKYEGDYFRRLEVLPGITGLWQVHARRDPSAEIYLALDLEYIDNWNLWLDVRILLQTIVVRCSWYGTVMPVTSIRLKALSGGWASAIGWASKASLSDNGR